MNKEAREKLIKEKPLPRISPRQMTDEPEEQVKMLIEAFKSEGATSVEATKQENGKFSIIARFDY